MKDEPVKQTKGNRVGDGTPGPGRKKGVPNKVTSAVKDMIVQALDKAGGVDYLVEQAEKNPAAFLTLVGKVIPMQIQGGDEGAAPISLVFNRRPENSDAG